MLSKKKERLAIFVVFIDGDSSHFIASLVHRECN